jgi:hypothetical protein
VRLICVHHTPGVHFLISSVQVYTFWCTPSTPCVGHVLVIAPKNPIWLTNCKTEILQMFISKFCFLVRHFKRIMCSLFFHHFGTGAGAVSIGKNSDKTGKLGNIHTNSFSLNCLCFFFRQLFINSPKEIWDLLVRFLCFIGFF